MKEVFLSLSVGIGNERWCVTRAKAAQTSPHLAVNLFHTVSVPLTQSFSRACCFSILPCKFQKRPGHEPYPATSRSDSFRRIRLKDLTPVLSHQNDARRGAEMARFVNDHRRCRAQRDWDSQTYKGLFIAVFASSLFRSLTDSYFLLFLSQMSAITSPNSDSKSVVVFDLFGFANRSGAHTGGAPADAVSDSTRLLFDEPRLIPLPSPITLPVLTMTEKSFMMQLAVTPRYLCFPPSTAGR